MINNRKINNLYEWLYLSQFCVRTHGFPYEWLEKLQFNKTYDFVNKLIEMKEITSDLQNQAKEIFEDELNTKRRTLWEIASQDIFMDAILTSSPVFLNTIETYLKNKEDMLSGYRNNPICKTERKIVTYLQRFCSKNDTNSFFGPTFWGSIDSNLDKHLSLKFGDKDTSQRFISYEYWAINKIVQCINQDKDIKVFLNPKTKSSVISRFFSCFIF